MKNNSGKRQVCFFCRTPFQIMTALHLALLMEKDAAADLYVLDDFSQADQLVDRMGNVKIFRNVLHVHEKDVEKYSTDKRNQSRTIGRLRMALSYIQLDRVAKAILKNNYDRPYDCAYIPCWSFSHRMVAMYFVKREYNTEIIFFEDSLLSYYSKSTTQPRPLDRICRYILFGRSASAAEPKKLLLYNPDLLQMTGVMSKNDIIVEAIPKWKQDGKFTDVMNKVFSYSEKDAIEPIIIFDGLYTGEKRQFMDSFYKKVAEIAGSENVIIKKHPLDKASETKGLKYYDRSDLPFELLCLNKPMEGKLLIGLATTAIATPKLLLDKEPFVLTLDKDKKIVEGRAKVKLGDIREMYKDKDKFFEAENENDALKFVKNYSERFTRKSD